MSGSINKVVGGAAAATAGASGEADRRLVVDRSFFDDQFLKCPVCLERFDQGERAPKSLPCHHTFCLRCVYQLFDHAQPSVTRNRLEINRAVKCPTCREEVFLRGKKIKDLPNDHRVIQMMDFLSQAGKKSNTLCPKHGQSLNFFCTKCHLPVCRDCTVIDHKESKGHVIIDFSKAMSEYSEQIAEMEKKSRDRLEKMAARSSPLANAFKNLDDRKVQVNRDIDETFGKFSRCLKERQEELKDIVGQITESQKTKINDRMMNILVHQTQLLTEHNKFKLSKNSDDPWKLFTIMQQMKKHEIEFEEVAKVDDNDCFESCEFKAKSRDSFLHDLNSLGEVCRKPDRNLALTVPATYQFLQKQTGF